MSWHKGPMLAFDVESTGPDPDFARIVTATLITITPGADTIVHEWLINPGVLIPQGAINVHGITNERAQEDGQDPAVAVADITGRIALSMRRGVPLVAFNAAYDLTVLDRECMRHNLPTLAERLDFVGPVIDPHVLDKKVDTYRKGKRTLTAVCEHYNVDLGNAHDASADALGAARVAYVMAARFPELDMDLVQLHEAQRGWRSEQAASLQDYFRRKDPTAVVNGDWPVQTVPTDWSPGAHPVDEQVAA